MKVIILWKNSKVAIYKIISIFLAAAGFILGLVTGIRLENIAVFFWIILSTIILVTFIIGIYSICKRLDTMINPNLNIENESKEDSNEEITEEPNNNQNDENQFKWEKSTEKENKEEDKFPWE